MSFVTALTFLTVIPLARWLHGDRVKMGRVLLWFPVIGLFIGVVMAAVLWGASSVFGGLLASAIAVVFLAGFTGALHLDGLADTFDGLFGGHDREARLRIMKDTNVGTFGVVAIVSMLLLKVCAVVSLDIASWTAWIPVPSYPDLDGHEAMGQSMGVPLWFCTTFGTQWVQIAALALAPMWGRWMMVFASAVGPYARKEGTAAGFVRSLGVLPATLLVLLPLAASTYLLGFGGPLVGLVAAGVAVGIFFWWRAKLGGVTGDTIGAIGEVTELAFLLAALAILPLVRWRWMAP